MSSHDPDPAPKYKVFNDPIHGNIEVEVLCVRIIDTPQFQRLRHIKQLGGCYFVYPGASHNRFEHSIGVSYLARKLVEKLRKRQPQLEITRNDILCLQIAGLCHDLGQGPFSRVFEDRFMKHFQEDWHQEKAALKMFEYMVEQNNLTEEFMKYNLTNTDLEFIKELILGPCVPNEQQVVDWPFFGRGKEKGFLYEILSNKRTGIDVDKWDSLARDSKHLGIRSNFDYKRFRKFARVINVNGVNRLGVRDKEVDTFITMCQTFLNLSRNAYKHKTTAIIEFMIGEAFCLANDYIKLGGANKKMSESVDDMEAYTELTDSVFYQILHSDNEGDGLAQARQILLNIQKRQHYRCIARRTAESESCNGGQQRLQRNWEMKVCTEMDKEFKRRHLNLTQSDIIVLVENFNYGDHHGNPAENVLFFSKLDQTVPMPSCAEQISDVLPDSFTEDKILIYCRCTDKEVLKLATQCFDSICECIGLPKQICSRSKQTTAPVDESHGESASEDTESMNLQSDH